MEVTQEMLQAAMTEAVKQKMFPKYAFLDQIGENWQAMRAVLVAALEEAPTGPTIYHNREVRACQHCNCACVDCLDCGPKS